MGCGERYGAALSAGRFARSCQAILDLTWQLGREEVVPGDSSRQSGQAHLMKTSMFQGLHLCGCLNGETAKLSSFSPYSDVSGNPTFSARPSQDMSTQSQHLHLGLW